MDDKSRRISSDRRADGKEIREERQVDKARRISSYRRADGKETGEKRMDDKSRRINSDRRADGKEIREERRKVNIDYVNGEYNERREENDRQVRRETRPISTERTHDATAIEE